MRNKHVLFFLKSILVIVNELTSECFKRIFSMFPYFRSPEIRGFALVYGNTNLASSEKPSHSS